ncbi:MAG: PAS sensor protein [Bacteroidales bacterium]|nr:PAS sensor protein [Bacteroidales bacterium]
MEDFFKHQSCSITICDKKGIILYMNERAVNTFGDKRGENLYACHPPHAIAKINQMLLDGSDNCYTIEKNGVKKMIFQTPWKNNEGEICGLIEYSFVIPFEMPHYVRK